MKIGNYTIKSVLTGSFALDGGAMFGTVPKVLWNKTNPADDKNRIAMEARCLLLISEKRKILVDVGLGERLSEKYGEKFASKFTDMYKLDQEKFSLEKSILNHGLKLSDITDVILTHLHFDHAGGATVWRDGRLQPTFPSAKYYIQKKNVEVAKTPNVREKSSYFKENFDALFDSNVIEVIDGNIENLIPDVSVFVSNGHTEGQQLVRVGKRGSRESMIYCGDIIPTSSHVRGPFIMGYDLNPLLVIAEKTQILQEMSQSGGMIFFEHDPYLDAARVAVDGNDFAVSEKVIFN